MYMHNTCTTYKARFPPTAPDHYVCCVPTRLQPRLVCWTAVKELVFELIRKDVQDRATAGMKVALTQPRVKADWITGVHHYTYSPVQINQQPGPWHIQGNLGLTAEGGNTCLAV